jgi:hypothetical protein
MNERGVQKILFSWGIVEKSKFAFAVPNTYSPYGWEADFLAVTPYGYAYEYEIKLTYDDFKADFVKKKKKHGTLISAYFDESDYKHPVPKRFYYVCFGFEPDRSDIPGYAGLIVIEPNGNMIFVKEAPDLNVDPLTLPELAKLAVSMSYKLFRAYGTRTEKRKQGRPKKKKNKWIRR